MKIKSVSGITCYVKNLESTTKFYELLGFEAKKKDANHVTLYSNWFWMDFIKEIKTEAKKGEGAYFYLSVDDPDEFYKYILSKGVKPQSDPADKPNGNREFSVHDPDGYSLVFFKRK